MTRGLPLGFGGDGVSAGSAVYKGRYEGRCENLALVSVRCDPAVQPTSVAPGNLQPASPAGWYRPVDKSLKGYEHDRVKGKKPEDDTHKPFRRLGSLIEAAGLSLHREREAEAVQKPAVEVIEADNEDRVFSQAMEGVRRVEWQPAPVPTPAPAPTPAGDTESEERRLMEAAFDGDPALTVEAHPEYIEGWVGLGGRRYLPKLRNGLYSIQGQIDLHGLSREEARSAVEAFICRMSRERSCCVKVIHGRGINSPNDRAVLKESLQGWLSSRRMSRHVVAYASAPFSDGGVGAVYVLLRRCL